jgi:hypothetical protein
MENYTTVRAILTTARQYHHELAERYEQWAEQVEDVRVSFLLRQMSQQEHEFDDKMASYTNQHVDRLLDTWLQYSPEKDLLKELVSQQDLPTDTTVLQVGILVNHFDQALIEYYSKAALQSFPGEVRELFVNIIEMLRYRKTVHSLETIGAQTV